MVYSTLPVKAWAIKDRATNKGTIYLTPLTVWVHNLLIGG